MGPLGCFPKIQPTEQVFVMARRPTNKNTKRAKGVSNSYSHHHGSVENGCILQDEVPFNWEYFGKFHEYGRKGKEAEETTFSSKNTMKHPLQLGRKMVTYLIREATCCLYEQPLLQLKHILPETFGGTKIETVRFWEADTT